MQSHGIDPVMDECSIAASNTMGKHCFAYKITLLDAKPVHELGL